MWIDFPVLVFLGFIMLFLGFVIGTVMQVPEYKDEDWDELER